MRGVILLACLFVPAALHAGQLPADDAYDDAVARRLVALARETRFGQSAQIMSYTAVVRERAAVMLRAPLKDRTLFRFEQATRVRWSRFGETVALVLASKAQYPGGEAVGPGPLVYFDPAADRLAFGVPGDASAEPEDDEPFHPLADGSEAHYRYRSGDTLTIRLADGRTVRVVEVQLIPRGASFRYLAGSLWIEPESGAVARAVLRLARRFDHEHDEDVLEPSDREELAKVPALLKPIEADIELIAIEYSLWNLEHWMPRFIRLEGYGRAGIFRLPFHAEITYEIEDVEEVDDATGPEPAPSEVVAEWAPESELKGRRQRRWGTRVQIYRPQDDEQLLASPDLPPPIWQDAPELISRTELEELARRLEAATSQDAPKDSARFGFEWARDDWSLVRYNRVEGLSLGVRGTVEHSIGTAWATLRLGSADLRPNVELAVGRLHGRRALTLTLHHQLAAVEGPGRPLGLGNSAAALFLGRDDGEYFRATGARLTVSPLPTERASYEWTVFAERQRAVRRETDFSLPRVIDRARGFRENIAADPANLVGASLVLSPWWGRDPLAPQAGIELFVEGLLGDYEFARARVTGRTALPLGAQMRLGLEAAVGTSWGAVPVQYRWYLGGPAMLRGYGGSAAVGTSLTRARAELARSVSFGAFTIFADAGWAGERGAFDRRDVLVSAGLGSSVLDGLIRVDVARALRAPTGWRLEMYLDALL